MLGFRFVKFQPTVYVLQYRNGKVRREGAGLAFFYFAPNSSLVAVPAGSSDVPFIFEEVTADFQQVTIQGQVTYRVTDPRRIAQLLNFTLAPNGSAYVSDDPQKLSQRVINVIKVLTRKELLALPLRTSVKSSDALVNSVSSALGSQAEIKSLGLEILGLSILAIRPTPETSRALEAEAREQILRDADEAIYTRRNASVEQERKVRENELNTEIAVENKKRQIREAQMEAERVVQEKQQALKQAALDFAVAQETRNADFVAQETANARVRADANAYALAAQFKTVEGVSPAVLQALAGAGMTPAQLIAQAFGEISRQSEKIGQLNITPDLLHELLAKK